MIGLKTLSFAVVESAIFPSAGLASYMENCGALISKWRNCGADLAACTIVEIEIMQQCKCHRFDEGRFEWVVITAAIAPDGVCGNFQPIPQEPGPGQRQVPLPDR